MALTDCRSARDSLSKQAFDQAAPPDDELTAAQRHVAGCAACRSDLARLARAIRSSDPDEVSCAEVRARLDERGPVAGAAVFNRHLQHCPSCAAEAAAWERILALRTQDALAEPPHYPTFDLSFLPQPSVLWTQVRDGLRRLSFEIPAALALAGQALFTPPPGLAVSYATAQAARRARARSKDSLVSLSVDDQPQDVRISMNVTAAEKALWLAVAMRLLSSGQPLTGARIALCNEQGQAQEIKTIRPGESEARFPDIAPGRYLVRIERAGKTWELPLVL
jgi:anti-sigma factor RsiW